LSEPEPIESLAGHDPKKYGLIVETDRKRGLLLPNLEGIDSAQDQFQICCQKGNIDPGEHVNLYRFTVDRFAK
jgi:AMMECR1 domain-containing protein